MFLYKRINTILTSFGDKMDLYNDVYCQALYGFVVYVSILFSLGGDCDLIMVSHFLALRGTLVSQSHSRCLPLLSALVL